MDSRMSIEDIFAFAELQVVANVHNTCSSIATTLRLAFWLGKSRFLRSISFCTNANGCERVRGHQQCSDVYTACKCVRIIASGCKRNEYPFAYRESTVTRILAREFAMFAFFHLWHPRELTRTGKRHINGCTDVCRVCHCVCAVASACQRRNDACTDAYRICHCETPSRKQSDV